MNSDRSSNEGIIFDIQRFCYQDGPGIRTTVFLKGCPLRCAWCHNPESQEAKPQIMKDTSTGESRICGRKATVQEVMEEVMRDKDFFEESGGGVTISGGEPTMQSSFTFSILECCKKHNIHTAVETCGFSQWAAFDRIRKVTDLFLYDVKLLTPELHVKWTRVDNKLILENLIRLKKAGSEIIVRMPLVPGVNDGDEFVKIVSFLSANDFRKFTIIPYHQIWHSKYRQLGYGEEPHSFREMSKEEITQYKELAARHGLEIID